MNCSRAGCGTRLRASNPDRFCSVHSSPRMAYEDLFPAWTRRAACRTMDPGLFDVDLPSSGQMLGTVLAAKRVCASCPVVTDCLRFGFRFTLAETPIYGGLTARERRAIAARRDRMKRGRRLLERQRLHHPHALVPIVPQGDLVAAYLGRFYRKETAA